MGLDKIALATGVLGAMVALGLVVYVFCRQLMWLTAPIDAVGGVLGVIANWLVLLCCLLSAGNAIVRYSLTPIRSVLADPGQAAFHPFLAWLMPAIEAYGLYANAFLEGQWYMFAGMVLFGAAYTLRVNEHVRVDLLYGLYSDKGRHWIDFVGGIVFLMPMCIVLIYFTWGWFVQVWTLNERSTNAGGLIRWPVILLLPFGFTIVAVQGLSEIIKRAAAIRGFHQHEYAYEKPLQ